MNRPRSLKRYFFRLIGPTSVLFSIFVVSFILINDYRVNETSRVENQKIIFQSFLSSIRQPLIQGSFVEARVRSREMLNLLGKQISCIEILVQENRINECRKANTEPSKVNAISEKLLFSDTGSESFAEVKMIFDNSDLVQRLLIQLTKAASIFVALGILLFSVLSIAFKRLRLELDEVLATSRGEKKSQYNFKIQEFQYISEKVAENINLAKDTASSQAALAVAKQVAHDIRSPVATLSILINSTEQDLRPEVFRSLLMASNNINDIANEVLNRHRNNFSKDNDTQENGEVLVNTLLQEIVSEKRINNSGKNKVQITLSDESNFCFVKMNKNALRRSVSNIVDNAVQATDSQGNVIISLKQTDDICEIEIRDDGCGVEESLLSKIIETGGTFNKQGGSGLGLSSAKKNIETADGKLSISSKLNEGTVVRLSLPLAETPSWCATEIKLSQFSKIKVIDDKQSIFTAWNEKLLSKSFDGSILYIGPQQIDSESFEDNLETLYLMDYDIKGYGKNGIEIILEKGICKNSILVTGHFDDESIKEQSKKMGLKMLPKTLIENLAVS